MRAIFNTGATIFRINLSHNSRETHQNLIAKIKNAAPKAQILLDTRGAEIRLGKFNGEFEIAKNAKFKLIARGDFNLQKNEFPIAFEKFDENVFVGEKIAIDGGFLIAEILEIKNGKIVCRAENSWKISQKRHVNLPRVRVNLPTIPATDERDLKFFDANPAIDFFALSFVRDASDLKLARKFTSKKLIAKIENADAVENLSEILKTTDGAMVARGDLGVEMGIENVPKLQKKILAAAKIFKKFSIVATEMLKSMCDSPRPTRAEVADVATAVWEKTDAVMLSEETAIGKFPVAAASEMAKIIKINER